MLLYLRKKTFSRVSFAFFKSILNLEYFQKKMTLIADVFPKLRTPKSVIRQLPKKFCFGGPFDEGHGKRAKTYLKSEREQLFHIY